MQKVTVYTLFDITQTKIVRPYSVSALKAHKSITTKSGWIQARNQQSNFETIIQVLSLRTQPLNISTPGAKVTELTMFQKGIGKVWSFSFYVEDISVYTNDIYKLGLLMSDCENVPMIINLTEDSTTDVFLNQNTIKFKVSDNA